MCSHRPIIPPLILRQPPLAPIMLVQDHCIRIIKAEGSEVAFEASTDAPVGALCPFSKSGEGTDQVSPAVVGIHYAGKNAIAVNKYRAAIYFVVEVTRARRPPIFCPRGRSVDCSLKSLGQGQPMAKSTLGLRQSSRYIR